MSKPQLPRCTLARFVPNEIDVEEVKRDGFNQHGILVVAVADPRLTWIEKQIIDGIGRKLYGRRG